MTDKPKKGDLRVWWIPQVPMEPFFVSVRNIREAKLLLNALADYDQFQLDNDIKPDYSNSGGLCVFDPEDNTEGPDGSWIDWEDDVGNTIDDYDLNGELCV
jgi:hypothetical protein